MNVFYAKADAFCSNIALAALQRENHLIFVKTASVMEICNCNHNKWTGYEHISNSVDSVIPL